MKLFDLDEILRVTQGKLVSGKSAAGVEGISINSRTIQPGDLFIAIKGERFDGHDFIPAVIKKGVRVIIVSKPLKRSIGEIPVIRVKDTTLALGHLARSYRDRFKIPVIAITGSAGKTTTKEFIAAVLQSRLNVLKNIGTENNHIGVPLTIFKLRLTHEALVLEVGTNRFGDIPWLTYVAHPTVAVFTNIGESHLALLKSPEHVLKEKFALARGIQAGGMIIVNTDNKYLRNAVQSLHKRNVISYGVGRSADYRATKIQIKPQGLSFRVNGKETVQLGSPVAANIYNALAAISCGRMFNIPYNNIKKSIKRVQVAGGRQAIEKQGRCWLINDTYNSNPVSFRSALQTLAGFNALGRKLLVCADMLELGGQAKALHTQMGVLAGQLKIAAVFGFGNFTKSLVQAARKKAPAMEAQFFKQLDELHQQLGSFVRRGDVVLVKGSRGMHLERTVEYLQKILPKL